MPKAHKVDTKLLGEVLKKYDGDYAKTADHLKVRKLYVRDRVLGDPHLRAIWVDNGTSSDIPDEIDVLARQEPPERPAGDGMRVDMTGRPIPDPPRYEEERRGTGFEQQGVPLERHERPADAHEREVGEPGDRERNAWYQSSE